MRRFLPTFLIITLVLAIYPFLGKDEKRGGVTGLPWQIVLLPDGSTKVFGLSPGRTTLGQAAAQLGDDMELAVMVAKGETGSLEMYYGQYRSGLLTAKLVLGAELDDESLKVMRDNAASTEVLKTGVRKYVLSEEDHEKAFRAPIQTIAYIPSTNLDHDTIVSRFGEPAEILTMGDQLTHYLYPAEGLDVILSEKGKEVLQYVAPSEFHRLRVPLD
ncbi:MAG: hypothetical protein WBO73_20010 [Gammaproteobacteria bacterium]|jgi:hypothetical protein